MGHAPSRLPVGTALKAREGLAVPDREDGENSRSRRRQHDTRVHTRSGNRGTEGPLDVPEDDSPVNVEKVIMRFREQTVNRFKAGSKAPDQYAAMFRRFAKPVKVVNPKTGKRNVVLGYELERCTRKQLSGPKGRELLLAHMAVIPAKSKRFVLAGLEVVWSEGLRLPWPINTKRDFGKTLPPIGRRHTPLDEEIGPRAEAAMREADAYLRVHAKLDLNYGWRPESQLAQLRRSDLRRDDLGGYIWADASDGRFKTYADIVAKVPPDLDEDLQELHQKYPALPDAPLLPYRDSFGNVDPQRPATYYTLERSLAEFEYKHGLRHTTPVYLRHWVKHQLVHSGLSDPAIAAWQGHEPPKDGSQKNIYDTPVVRAIVKEQAECLPHGLLPVVLPPQIKVEPSRKAGYSIVDDYFEDRIGLMETLARLEKAKAEFKERPSTPVLQT